MIRVRRSYLEDFRRLVETDYGDQAVLIQTILGHPPKPSWQMQAGTAWHALLADPRPVTGKVVQSGDYSFSAADVRRGRDHCGPGLWEVDGNKVFDVFGVPVDVTGTADHIRGHLIQDNKTKFSTADAGNYEQQLQWRFYMLIHGALEFRYNLFHMSEPKNGFCQLREITSFSFWNYPNLLMDCTRWLSLFLDWVHLHKLTEHLDAARAGA